MNITLDSQTCRRIGCVQGQIKALRGEAAEIAHLKHIATLCETFKTALNDYLTDIETALAPTPDQTQHPTPQ